MPLSESQYSQAGRPENSALTGRLLTPEDAYFYVNGSMLGVKAKELRGITPEEFTAMKEEWAREVPHAHADAAIQAPKYEDMTFEELKALAAKRKVDISGRRSKEAVAQALRAADVTERFAPAPETPEGNPLDLSEATGE